MGMNTRDSDRGATRVGQTGAGQTGAGETTRASGHEDDRHRDAKHERFGGFNWGADFFGWLVAVGVTALAASIAGAVAAAVGSTLSVTQSEAQRSAGTIGIGTGVALLVVLMIGYYAGGYVAGRMSRFDGGRQGFGVWLIGLVVTVIVAVVGAIAGSEYNILSRVDLPSLPIPTETATWGGLIALAAVVAGTLLAAFAGGKAGHHYHDKVDRYQG